MLYALGGCVATSGSSWTGSLKGPRNGNPTSDIQVAADRTRPDSQRGALVPSILPVASGCGRAFEGTYPYSTRRATEFSPFLVVMVIILKINPNNSASLCEIRVEWTFPFRLARRDPIWLPIPIGGKRLVESPFRGSGISSESQPHGGVCGFFLPPGPF
jgi:hypothetical protein